MNLGGDIHVEKDRPRLVLPGLQGVLDCNQIDQEIGGPMETERLRRLDIKTVVAPDDDINWQPLILKDRSIRGICNPSQERRAGSERNGVCEGPGLKPICGLGLGASKWSRFPCSSHPAII